MPRQTATMQAAAGMAALMLAACGPTPGADSPPDAGTPNATSSSLADNLADAVADQEPSLAIDGEGLRLVAPDTGRSVPVAFGTPRDATLRMLEFRGSPGTGTNSECGAGPLDYASWPDGLTLHFQDDALVGWALDERGKGAMTTMSGIGIGSTRADLDAVYSATVEQTTLGQEFSTGALFGILDQSGPAGTITNMWAGTSCNFR